MPRLSASGLPSCLPRAIDRAVPRLVLASASPRRAELCREAGLVVEIDPAGIDERARPREDPASYARRMARRKADVVARRRAAKGGRPWVIGADTVVVADGWRILRKPRDRAEARRMLGLLLGRTHHVLTGLCVTRPGGPFRTRVVDTMVAFLDRALVDVEAYLDSDEWRDKAGAYAVQGIAGARLIASIYGSYTNVVGLPVAELRGLLREIDAL
jgi:nucleoside triphosphate pyrophosphatase